MNVVCVGVNPIFDAPADLNIGVFYVAAISSLSVVGVIMAGWASNNKYALLGGLRSSAQMFSYELSLGLSWVGVVMFASSFKVPEIVASQGAGFWNWYAVLQFPAFLVYLISATAEPEDAL